MVCAETQDLGIRDLPDAHAQLIEMQLLLEEISSNVEVLQEKVRARPCCSQQCLMWHCQDSVIQHAVLARSHLYGVVAQHFSLQQKAQVAEASSCLEKSMRLAARMARWEERQRRTQRQSLLLQ